MFLFGINGQHNFICIVDKKSNVVKVHVFFKIKCAISNYFHIISNIRQTFSTFDIHSFNDSFSPVYSNYTKETEKPKLRQRYLIYLRFHFSEKKNNNIYRLDYMLRQKSETMKQGERKKKKRRKGK